MTWINVAPQNIGFNNQFGGSEGHFTTEPQWTLGEDTPFKIKVVNGRVTEVAYDGLVYKHQNADGANIHGGNHTTSEWFTFDIGQFAYVNHLGVREQALNSEPGFQGAHTITARCPLPAPCFGPDNLVLTQDRGWTKVKDLKAGDKIKVRGDWSEILWTGGSFVDVNEKNMPVNFARQDSIFSPQHRLLFLGKWAKAKWFVPRHARFLEVKQQWYGHILLAEHLPIEYNFNFYAESLLPTDRALSGFKPEIRDQILNILNGRTIEMTFPKWKKRDLLSQL